MGQLIQVGEKFPLFERNIENLRYLDAALFEVFDNESGYFLSILLNKPNDLEKKLFHSPHASFRLYEREGHILPLIRFGNSTFVFEMDFDPTLYGDRRSLQFKDTNNTIYIALIDSSDFLVKGLRQGNLPLKMIQRCHQVWNVALLDKGYAEKHKEWYSEIQRTLSVQELWEKAEPAGKIGEIYDLTELNRL